MKILRNVMSALVSLAAIGMLAFLVAMTQTVDPELHQRRLARLRDINNLDVQLNRIMVEARFTSIALAGDQRVRVADQLGTLLEQVSGGPEALRGLSEPTDQALDAFVNVIEDKFVLAFDFEARNSTANTRLIGSLDAVPLHADALAALAAPAAQAPVRELLARLKSEVVSFAVTPTPTNEPNIRALLAELQPLADAGSEAFRNGVQPLSNSIEEVLADKKELMERLNGFLARPTGGLLQALQQSYLSWYDAQLATVDQYRLWLGGYAAILLLALALLGMRLARSFRELDRANADLSHANEHLEDQVQKRTRDLSKALADLQASQAQLVQSEKMASLGTMVAGVAHEINTPLGYARSNTEIVRNSLGEIRRLVAAQDQALELLATAGATEEQVARALAEARTLAEALDAEALAGDLDNLLADADHGMLQIADLVGGLKDFSRVDRSRNDLFNVNDGLEAALKICHSQLKQKVEVVKSYGKLPQIECAPGQLNQVFLNLLNNAAQAIDGTGKIYLHTAADADGVSVRVLDTGCGMSDEVRARIFEPFYTTKPVGKGTGLGLSIVYRIIADHGGRIEARSTPGKGSEFIIRLPLRQGPQAQDRPEPVPQLAAA